jgi:hypothetical protein
VRASDTSQYQSHWKILDDILALIHREAMNGEKDFINGLADWHVVADQKDSGHRVAGRYP